MRMASAAAAVCSSPGWHTEDSISGMPNCAAARAAAAAPPSTRASRPPMGASRTGRRAARPSTRAVLSMRLTSRSTRGRKASASSAWRLRRAVVSVSDPPTRYAHGPGGRLRRAAATISCRVRNSNLFCKDAHGPIEALERGRVHAPAHQLLDDRDRLAVGPDLLGLGVEPDAFGVDVGDALDPGRARLLVEVLDRAAGLQDLVGAHGGVADEDHLVVVAVLVQQLPGARALRMAPPVVLPHEVVQAVVEVVELEVLELGLGGAEQLLGELHVLVHGAADVHQHEHLDGVAPLGAHVDVEVGLSRGLADGGFQVELVRRALAGEFSQSSKRDLDVAGTELDRIVEVAVLALVPDLDRAAIAALLLADAHAFRVVAVGAERRGAAGADPFGAALVAAFLLLQALAQRLHQLLPAAERLDLLLFLLREGELDLLQQPFQRDLRLYARDGLDPLPELGEGAVELVEIGLVLHQRGARQVIEVVHRRADDPLVHGLEQGEVFLNRDRQLVRLELEEEVDQHRRAYCSPRRPRPGGAPRRSPACAPGARSRNGGRARRRRRAAPRAPA